MKKLFLILMLAVLASLSFAAVANYTFGYSAGTYTEITGGTILGTAVVAGSGATALDDVLYPNTPVPFQFGFNGRRYSNLTVSSNGYLIIGGIATMSYTPVSSTTVADGSIAILGRDLMGNVETGNLGQIRYETLGASPNRVFVIQWKNFKRYLGTLENYNFQIRLRENGNVIDMVFGPMTVNYTSTSHPQLGLRGTANTDYINRAVTTDWTASTAGIINTDAVTLTTTVFPASGCTYTFTPDVPTTFPTLATPVYPGIGASGIAVSTNLSWADGGGWTESFKLYFGTNNGPPWNLVDGIDQGYALSYDPPVDLNANTTYYWKIVPRNTAGGDNPNAVVWSFMTSGPPLSGTKTVGGTNPDYATLAEAIAALNNGGGAVGTGGVTFNVRANHTESITAPLVITATGTSGNEIIIRKDPNTNGANPLITRTDGGSNITSILGGLGDAIIRLDGTDYITFNGIDVAATQSGIEYGYLTNKPSAANGCKYVTITNSVVTMTKGTSAYVIGIYVSNGPTSLSSAAGVTVTTTDGINQNVLIAGNTIQNVHTGVHVRGFSTAAYYDNNITVGQSGLPNVIQNFGGGSTTTTYGVYFYYVNNPIVAYTTINNAGGGGAAHGSTLYGVYFITVTGNVEASNNTISLSNSSVSATHWIYNGSTVTSETYNNNTLAAGAFAATSTSYLIYSSNSTLNKTISGNVTSGTINKTGVGAFYVYYNLGSPASGTEIVSNNNFSNITLTGTSIFYGIYSNTAAGHGRVCTGNTLSNITVGTGTFYGLYTLAASSQVSGNSVFGISGGSIIYAIYYSGATTNVYNNSVYNLSSSGASAVYGIYQSGGTTSACYGNTIYNLSGSNVSSIMYGIYISSGGTTNIYNNMISGLSAPGSATALVSALNGIRIAGGTTNNIHYNSCLLSFNGANAYFASAGLYLSGGTTNVIRNNIFVNNCVAGASGKSAAVWSTTTTAPYSIGAGTNKNIYFASTVGFINSVNYPALEDYKAFLADREQGSYYEDVPFQGPTNLHINASVPTRVESNAVSLYPDFDTDYDNQNRNDLTPDIGADEGNFTVPAGAPGNVTLLNPADSATGINPFSYVASWAPPTTGAPVQYYVLYVAQTVETIFDEFNMDPILAGNTSFNLAAVPGLSMDYMEDWYWAVVAYNSLGEGSDVDAPDFEVFRFTTSGQLMAEDALPLGIALAGYSKKGTLTVTNIGAVALTFSATSSPEIVLGALRYTIPANSSVELAYTFNAPATPGAYNGLITLTETGPGSSTVEIAVTATVTDNTIIGTGTVELQLPVEPFYRYSYSQTIFYPGEMGWSNDYRIEKIYYYFNGFETCEQTKDFVVYMGHTSNSTFATSASWLPLANLTQVYAQTNEPQLFAGGYWMEFTLDQPFIYNCTDNLVIGVAENFFGTTYDATGNFFYCTATPGLNRSIRYQSDTVIADPAAPAAGTLVAGHPNIKFTLGAVPTTPQILVSPSTWDFGTVLINTPVTRQINITNIGGGATPLVINSITPASSGFFTLTNLPAPDYALTAGAATSFTVQYLPTAAGLHNATFTINHSLGTTQVVINGTGFDPRITTYTYVQNFDGVSAPAFPIGWTPYKSNTSSSIYTSTTYSQSPLNSVYMYNYTTAEQLRLISPQVTLPMNSFKVKFWARGTAGYTLKVGTVNALDGTGVFTQLGEVTLTASFAEYSVSFANQTGGDQYICLQHGLGGTYRSMYIDNFSIDQLLANDMAATAITGNPMSIVGNQMSFDVTVLNNGTAAQNAYNVHLKRVGDGRYASITVTTPLAPGASAVHTINWTPAAGQIGNFGLVGEVELVGDQNSANNESAPLTVYIYPAGTFIPTVGDITTATTTNQLPLNVYYKNSVSETIYLAHELQMTSGTINAIIYQNNFTQDLTKPVKIWMKHTADNDLTVGWPAFTGYQLVFEGNVHFPLGVNAVIIPLDVPFVYTGGNLAMRVYRVWEDVYWLSSNVFYHTASPEYPNRSRSIYEDTVGAGFDPANPPTGIYNAYLLSNIPNTAFIVNPASPISNLTAPVVTATVSGTNVLLSWPLVSGAYSYRIYASDDPSDWSVTTPIATVRTNTYSAAVGTNLKKFYKVVAVSTYRNSDLGTVLNPALSIGFDNSRVKAEPLIPQTRNKD